MPKEYSSQNFIYKRTLREIAKKPNNYMHRVRSFLVVQTKIVIGLTIFIVGKTAVGHKMNYDFRVVTVMES